MNPFRVIIIQRGDGSFHLRNNHAGQVGAGCAVKIMAQLKKEAVANLFKPASAIVNEVLLEEITDAPCPSLPNPTNLARAANYLRKQLRPMDPTDLDFDLDEHHIPGDFLRADIKVSNYLKNYKTLFLSTHYACTKL